MFLYKNEYVLVYVSIYEYVYQNVFVYCYIWILICIYVNFIMLYIWISYFICTYSRIYVDVSAYYSMNVIINDIWGIYIFIAHGYI